MDISFQCGKCGQRLQVEEAGAGVEVQCPKCGQSLTVPNQPFKVAKGVSPPPSSVAASQDTKQCPFCAETIKSAAKICRSCGRDLVTGKAEGTRSQVPILRIAAVVLLLAIFAGGYFGYRFWKDRKTQAEMAVAAAKADNEKQTAESEAAAC